MSFRPHKIQSNTSDDNLIVVLDYELYKQDDLKKKINVENKTNSAESFCIQKGLQNTRKFIRGKTMNNALWKERKKEKKPVSQKIFKVKIFNHLEDTTLGKKQI